jgi:iron complex transport system permease protein
MKRTLLLIVVPLLALPEILSGPAHIDVLQALADLIHGNDSVARIILLEVRLPRLLLAMLCGGAIAISGAALQGLLRNPLASPDLLGISQTSALLAVIALYFGFSLQAWFVLPLAALTGAVIAVLLLLRLTRHVSGTEGLILAGIALTALAGSLTTFTLTFAPNPYALQDAYFWLLGSVSNRSIADVGLALPFMTMGTALLLSCGRCLDALSLGEDTAAALGFPLAASPSLCTSRASVTT